VPLPRSFVVVCLLAALAASVGCSALSADVAARHEPSVAPDAPGQATGSSANASNPAGVPNERWLPDPDAALPRAPARLAERLALTTRALFAAIDRWRASGATAEWPPPREVVLLALDLQRSVQTLAVGTGRRAATIAALPAPLRSAIRDVAEAAAVLRSGMGRVTASRPITMRTRPPLPPDVLLGYYREAARRFGVPWTLLAAVHYLETKFGRVVSNSWAGAQGPMQFIPSTWAAYGMGGDIRDTRDAINGAANYLHANGAPQEPRRALWAYNPVAYYGEAVLRYERQMRRDVRMFYALYTWQVFVRTRSGPVQLTGPGADVRSST
jgi:soluble lytic murein transglycosylase-like protein